MVQLISPEDHATVIAAESEQTGAKRFQAEYRMTRKDGKVVWVSDTAVVVRGATGIPVMGRIIVDITERKQLEIQLHDRSDGSWDARGRVAARLQQSADDHQK